MSPGPVRQQWFVALPWLVGLVAVGPLVALLWLVFVSKALAPFAVFQLAVNLPILGFMLLLMTPLAMPPAALVGAGLAAGVVWLQQWPLE